MEKRTDIQFYEETTVNVMELLRVLWKWAWLIVLSAFLAASAAYLGTKLFVTPTYKTEFTAYVNNKNSSAGSDISSMLSSSDLMASKSLANSYAEILTSRDLLIKAAEAAGKDQYSYEELVNAVSTEVQSNTEIITVSVVMESAQDAVDIATSLAEISIDYIADIVEGSSMKIIDTSILPATFYTPNYMKNTVMGGFLGALLVCGAVIILYLLDDTIRSEKDLVDRLDVTIVGSIPDLELAGKKSFGYGYEYGQKK